MILKLTEADAREARYTNIPYGGLQHGVQGSGSMRSPIGVEEVARGSICQVLPPRWRLMLACHSEA